VAASGKCRNPSEVAAKLWSAANEASPDMVDPSLWLLASYNVVPSRVHLRPFTMGVS
jgi:hypothetical protein